MIVVSRTTTIATPIFQKYPYRVSALYLHKVGSSVTFTQRPGTHTTQTILAVALLLIDFFFFFVSDFEKIALTIKRKLFFYHALTWKGHDAPWKWKNPLALYLKSIKQLYRESVPSLTYFLTSECSQCTRSRVSHVQLTPTMLGVIASVWT